MIPQNKDAVALARELASLTRRLEALERASQLTSSTVPGPNGPVSVPTALNAGMEAGALAAEAITRASSAESKADGAVVTYFGEEEPGQGVKFGDLWRRPDGSVMQYNGAEWAPLTDPSLAADLEIALDRIAGAEEALDGVVSTFYADDANAPADPQMGDLWVVTDRDNLTRRWSGTQWIDMRIGWGALDENTTSRIESAEQDAATAIANAASAQAKADGAVVTFFGTREPTAADDGAKDGDLWYTDDVLKQRVGNEWVRVDETTNSAIAGVQSGLTNALDRLEDTEAALDGKVTTYVGPEAQLPQCTNFVANGGFENGGVGWTTGQAYNYCAEAAYSGSGGVRITTTTTGNVYPRSSVWNEVVPGETLTMTAMCRVVSGTVAHNGTGIVVRYAFEDGTTGSWQVGRVSGGPTSPSTGWKKVQAKHTVPANAVRAQAGFWVSYTSAVAVMDWDDVVVTGSVVDISKLQIGDLWVVTDKNNLTRRWDGAVWADLKVGWEALDDATTARIDAASRDAATAIANAASAQAKADGAVVTFFGTNTPSGAKEGDFWYVDGILKQRVGTQWVRVDAETSAAIGGVQDDLADALDQLEDTAAAVDGKITTFYMPSTSTPPNPSEGDLWVVSNSGNLIRRWNGTSWVNLTVGSGAIANNAITSTKISNNAVTAPKLEANLVLTSRVIAGEPDGRHAEMDSNGFHVYGSSGRELARFGVPGSDDSLTLTTTDGKAVASISEVGAMSGAQVNADDIFFRGTNLDALFDARPRGIVGWIERTTACTWQAAGTERPFLRVDARLEPGRMYRVYLNNTVTRVASSATLVVLLRYQIGAECTINGTQIQATRAPSPHELSSLTMSQLFTLPASQDVPVTVSFLVTQQSIGGNAGLAGEKGRPSQLVVEDIGPYINQTGVTTLNASTDRSPLADKQTLTVGHEDLRIVSNSFASTASNEWQSAWVGTSPDLPALTVDGLPLANAELATMLYFPNVTTQLSGRNMMSARLGIPMQEWKTSAGMDAISITPHGFATGEGGGETLDLTTPVTTVAVPAPTIRWVDLPATLLASLKSGMVRGFVLHRGVTRDPVNHPEFGNDGTDYFGTFGHHQAQIANNQRMCVSAVGVNQRVYPSTDSLVVRKIPYKSVETWKGWVRGQEITAQDANGNNIVSDVWLYDGLGYASVLFFEPMDTAGLPNLGTPNANGTIPGVSQTKPSGQVTSPAQHFELEITYQ